MIKSPLEIILEAGKKKNNITPSGSTDYTKEEPENEEPETKESEDKTEEEKEDAAPTDYTKEEPEDDEPETVEDSDDETLEPNDYSSEDPEDEDDESEDGDVEPNDYSSEDPEGEDDESEPSSNLAGGSEEGTEEEEDETQKKRELFEDFTKLYDLVKEFISKLSSHTVSTIFVNKIMIQISKNLNDTRRSIWNHIMKDFDRKNYVQNLTSYNFFVENIRINIQMLDKVKDYVSKSETFK